MRVAYDGITPSRLPADGAIYLSYIDGAWPNYSQLAALFPGRIHVPIAVDPAHDATVLDIETGDARPDQAPGWAVRQRNRGQEPTCYMNESTWGQVVAAFHAAGVAQPQYWVANYSREPVILPGSIGLQYLNTAGYDRSVVADYWPGVDPPPHPAPNPSPTPGPDPSPPGDLLMKDVIVTVAVNGQNQTWAREAEHGFYWGVQDGALDAAALALAGFVNAGAVSPGLHHEWLASSPNNGQGNLSPNGTPNP